MPSDAQVTSQPLEVDAAEGARVGEGPTALGKQRERVNIACGQWWVICLLVLRISAHNNRFIA